MWDEEQERIVARERLIERWFWITVFACVAGSLVGLTLRVLGVIA